MSTVLTAVLLAAPLLVAGVWIMFGSAAAATAGGLAGLGLFVACTIAAAVEGKTTSMEYGLATIAILLLAGAIGAAIEGP